MAHISRSSRISGTSTGARVVAACPTAPSPAGSGLARSASTNSSRFGGCPKMKFFRTLVVLVDRSSVGSGQAGPRGSDVLSTVSRSKVELTAWPTSPNALSSPHRPRQLRVRASNSWNSRTFSMAITAWSAKGLEEGDLLLREWADLRAADQNSTNRNCLSRSNGATSMVRTPSRSTATEHPGTRSSRVNVLNVDRSLSMTARPATEPRLIGSSAVIKNGDP